MLGSGLPPAFPHEFVVAADHGEVAACAAAFLAESDAPAAEADGDDETLESKPRRRGRRGGRRRSRAKAEASE
jgi:hypothetical protein